MLADIEDEPVHELGDILLLLKGINVQQLNVIDVVDLCYKFFACEVGDNDTTLQWRNELLKHVVLWTEEHVEIDVLTTLYSTVALASSQLFDGYTTDIGMYTPPSMRTTFVCDYTVSQLLTAMMILDSEWNSMTYSNTLFRYMEQYDAHIGRLYFCLDDAEFDQVCDVADYQGNKMLFLEHCANIMSHLHCNYALASSCLDSNYRLNEATCPNVEATVLNKCKMDSYAGCKMPFRNTYWALAESPTDASIVKLADKVAKAKGAPTAIRRGAVATSRKILKVRGRGEFIALKEQMFGTESWLLYPQLQEGDAFDRSASGVLLLYMCEYLMKNVFNIPNWFNTYVDLYPMSSIWDKSLSSPIIVKFFAEYHVMQGKRVHICGHASKAIEKWLRLQLPPVALRQHFSLEVRE